jgi:hypothetical protein
MALMHRMYPDSLYYRGFFMGNGQWRMVNEPIIQEPYPVFHYHISKLSHYHINLLSHPLFKGGGIFLAYYNIFCNQGAYFK